MPVIFSFMYILGVNYSLYSCPRNTPDFRCQFHLLFMVTLSSIRGCPSTGQTVVYAQGRCNQNLHHHWVRFLSLSQVYYKGTNDIMALPILFLRLTWLSPWDFITCEVSLKITHVLRLISWDCHAWLFIHWTTFPFDNSILPCSVVTLWDFGSHNVNRNRGYICYE